jgi:hypothetical protein
VDVVLLWIRGLATLGLLVGLTFYAVFSLRWLIREPTPKGFGVFRFLAWLAIVQVVLEVLIAGGRWLHLSYGVLMAVLLYCVGGLEPGGWFYKSLAKPPAKVGAYVFWASFIALLLHLRFIGTR